MSRAEDRIRVPSNGHRPPLAPEPEAPTTSTDEALPPFAQRRGVAIDATPTQLAVGFGVIASLILLVLRARRRRG